MMISVIVPVYNVEDYLPHCLESIASQTYTDFEAILVDDGSTDSSGRICDGFCARDPRFRVIHLPNRGVSSARNAGLSEAGGEYVAFIDGDDCVLPTFLATLRGALVKTGCAMSMAMGRIADSADALTGTGTSAGGRDTEVLSRAELISRLFGDSGTDWQYMVVWNKLYGRTLIGDVRFRRMTAEDMLFNLEVFLKAGRSAYVPEELYCWVRRPGSLTRRGITKGHVDSVASYLRALSLIPREDEGCRAACLQKLYKRILSVRHDARGTEHEAYARNITERAVKETFREFIHSERIPFKLKWGLPISCRIPAAYRLYRWMREMYCR